MVYELQPYPDAQSYMEYPGMSMGQDTIMNPGNPAQSRYLQRMMGLSGMFGGGMFGGMFGNNNPFFGGMNDLYTSAGYLGGYSPFMMSRYNPYSSNPYVWQYQQQFFPNQTQTPEAAQQRSSMAGTPFGVPGLRPGQTPSGPKFVDETPKPYGAPGLRPGQVPGGAKGIDEETGKVTPINTPAKPKQNPAELLPGFGQRFVNQGEFGDKGKQAIKDAGYKNVNEFLQSDAGARYVNASRANATRKK